MGSLPDELHLEILNRLPPLPQVLARASVVCKTWRGVVNDPAFLRELHRKHRGPPATLGFFHNSDELPNRFVHAGNPASFALGSGDRRTDWQIVDCRHGRVLLSDGWDHRFLVWHPMTGERHLVRAKSLGMEEAPDENNQVGAALLCDCATGEDGQGQGMGCHASPFRVAVVFKNSQTNCMIASVFSSLSNQWSRQAELPLAWQVRSEPCITVGNILYQPLTDRGILAFDTDERSLATLQRPTRGNVRLLKVDGGVLGLAGVMGYELKLWALELDAETWVLRKTVDLREILPSLLTAPSPKTDPRFNHMPRVKIIGVAEEGDALFVWTMMGIFMLCVESMELTKVHDTFELKTVYPYAAFYLPAANTAM
ncbi:hypothetical protein ZWY2020_026868 [Hordeum vulgare]|nr:hypothetical protein ZWY2020_026868 [Hordeum vulgare]